MFGRHQLVEEFEYFFLDERTDRLYQKEAKEAKVYVLFALITILISCLGLFGLVAYSVEKRSKEIGVRRVLGASEWSIVQLFSREFAVLALLANVAALPAAYFYGRSYLANFVYRADLSWASFGVAALMVLVVALLTTGGMALSAARTNPVKALRDE